MSKKLTADERIERLEEQMWVIQELLFDIRTGYENLVLVLKSKDRRVK